MSQSRKASLAETAVNVTIGYVVAVSAQIVILPMFGLHARVGENMLIGLMFTAISIVRQYVLRRIFNAYHSRG